MIHPDTELVDPLGDDWDARHKRGGAVQREQSVEAHAGEWIRADVIEGILVAVARTCHGILAGIPDALRSGGASHAVVVECAQIIDASKIQIAEAFAGVAGESARHVEAMERDIEATAASMVPISKERTAPARKPRGVAKMKRTK